MQIKQRNYLILFLCLAPLFIGFLYVYKFGVNVPVHEEMLFVPIFGKFFSRTLKLSDLCFSLNQHLIFFPTVTKLFLGVLTKYNSVAEMYLTQLLLGSNLAIFFLKFRKQFNLRENCLWFIPIPFLVFSLRQYETMLLGSLLALAFSLTFTLLAFYLIDSLPEIKRVKIKHISLVVAIISGTVASFSFANGLLVWPLGFFLMMLLPRERFKKLLYSIIWVIIGCVEWLIYIFNYKRPAHIPGITDTLNHPLTFLEFFFTCLGNALFWEMMIALITGIVLTALLLACFLFVFKNNRLRENSFWITVSLFSFLTILSVAASRAGFGLEYITVSFYSSRFSTLAIPLVIALYVMLLDLSNVRKQNVINLLTGATLGFIILGLLTSYVEGFSMGEKIRAQRERTAFLMATFEEQPDEYLKSLYFLSSAEIVKDSASILKKLSYNVFADKNRFINPAGSHLSTLSSPALYSIGTINDLVVSREKQPIALSVNTSFILVKGWALDRYADEAAGGVYLDIDGKLYPAFYGTFMNVKIPKYRYSGFERAVPVSIIGKGLHALSIIILSKDRKGYYKPETKILFEIK